MNNPNEIKVSKRAGAECNALREHPARKIKAYARRYLVALGLDDKGADYAAQTIADDMMGRIMGELHALGIDLGLCDDDGDEVGS
jgi:hypothetical protein